MNLVAYDVYAERIKNARTITHFGKVTQVVGLVIESAGPAVSIGRLCSIENFESGAKVKAEVVGFRDDRILLMPLGPISGITPGAARISPPSPPRPGSPRPWPPRPRCPSRSAAAGAVAPAARCAASAPTASSSERGARG